MFLKCLFLIFKIILNILVFLLFNTLKCLSFLIIFLNFKYFLHIFFKLILLINLIVNIWIQNTKNFISRTTFSNHIINPFFNGAHQFIDIFLIHTSFNTIFLYLFYHFICFYFYLMFSNMFRDLILITFWLLNSIWYLTMFFNTLKCLIPLYISRSTCSFRSLKTNISIHYLIKKLKNLWYKWL